MESGMGHTLPRLMHSRSGPNHYLSVMKNIAILVLSLTALSARADLVLKQKMENPAMNGELTMSIKGDLMRTDMGKDTTSILNTSTGETLTLMHAQKMAMKSTNPQIKAAATTPPVEAPKFIATGQMEKVGEHNCEIYTMESAGSKMTMWIAKDFPNWEQIKTGMATMSKIGGAASTEALPGMSVKSVTEAGGMKTTITLISATTDALDAALFVAPTGYQALGQ
jgi:Domain of unknown function (DUF4412)